MAKKEGSKFNNCSPSDVLKMFDKLGGFSVKESPKHVKVTHRESGKATMVPRAKRVDRYLLSQGIIKKYLVQGLGFSQKEVEEVLDC